MEHLIGFISVGLLICCLCLGLPLRAESMTLSLDTLSLSSGAGASAPAFSLAIQASGQNDAPVSFSPSHATSESARFDESPFPTTADDSKSGPISGQPLAGQRLGRITAYWAGEGDYYTARHLSATGVHLHGGHCAVDPRIIPYGSVVEIAGVGRFLAVDTGSAVIARKAARLAARTGEERDALVVDLFFESRKAAEAFATSAPPYISIRWQTPLRPSALSSAPVITPLSMQPRLGLPAEPLRSPVGGVNQSYAVR